MNFRNSPRSLAQKLIGIIFKELDVIKSITLILLITALLTTCSQNSYTAKNNAAQLAVTISTDYNKNHDWFADHEKFVPVILGTHRISSADDLSARQDRIRVLNYAAYIAKLALEDKVTQQYLSDDLNCLIVNLAEMTISPNNSLPYGTQFNTLRDYQSKFGARCVQSGVQF